MQLSPLYLDRPLICLDGDPAAVVAPTVTQRRRLADAVGRMGDDELATPSRCDGWTALEVVSHLDGTNGFWSMSITAALAHEPSRLLHGFDPVATPAAMVDSGRDRPTAEVVDAFVGSTERLIADIGALDEDHLDLLGEAPPGHLTVSGVLHHALWDSWIHERDILLPLGAEPQVADDEVAASLRYAAALSPSLNVGAEPRPAGTVVIAATDPDLVATVSVGDVVAVTTGAEPGNDVAVVRGPSVDLLEAFSARAEFPCPVHDDWSWMLTGLTEAFDQA